LEGLLMTTPWVSFSIDVPPSLIYYQLGKDGPVPIRDCVWSIGASEMLSGVSPEKTCYAAEIKDQLGNGCHGRPAKFLELIESLKQGWDRTKPNIQGAINRRGEIVLHNGAHRTGAAIALGIDTIPVDICFRDEDWVRFRHSVSELNGGFKLYQSIPHPDFDVWPCWRRDTQDRLKVILDVLPSDKMSICDVGCHSGVLSHGMARAGYTVIGVDQDSRAVDVARQMSSMTYLGSKNARFINASFHAELGLFDAVVCLSALNHAFIRGRGERMLRDICKSRFVILDIPEKGDPIGGDTEMSDPSFFQRWVINTVGGTINQIESQCMRKMFVWEA
jgi:2-polyprenyl-3-methyl-5-hydroxy-6-metoxy-1,4-benzoquinol methylase